MLDLQNTANKTIFFLKLLLQELYLAPLSGGARPPVAPEWSWVLRTRASKGNGRVRIHEVATLQLPSCRRSNRGEN